MRLVVPYLGTPRPADLRLIRLADFLGVGADSVPLEKQAGGDAKYLCDVFPTEGSCLVVNPKVIQEWIGEHQLSDFVSSLVSRFSYVLVHAPCPDRFDDSLIAALSKGEFQSVRRIDSVGVYEVAIDSRDICGAFSGLSFGPTNPANDLVFSSGGTKPAVEKLISISGEAFMARMKWKKAEILFLGSVDVADLSREVGDAPLTDYFSQILPAAMALKHIFGRECWNPGEHHASIIVDDPLLRRKYGFLDFEFLLSLMKQHNFHTEIAFIPRNFRRSSKRMTRMFRENADNFALCFHGNDHLSAEFASTNTALLDTMLQIAERRMNHHRMLTGVECDRVMVFPQGNFSVEAMSALRSRNFDAAVNTVSHPKGKASCLTIAELAQPAVVRYGGFPLFLRKDSQHTQSQDIAFNLFFGRPVLVVEHHHVFQHPEILTEVVTRINSMKPKVNWSRLASAVANSTLSRLESDGTHSVRAYSGTVQVVNKSTSIERFVVEWTQRHGDRVEKVLVNGKSHLNFETDDIGTRIRLDLAPGRHTISLLNQLTDVPIRSLGFRWSFKAFMRRRLSEARDNYLSKNPQVLAAAQILQKRFLH